MDIFQIQEEIRWMYTNGEVDLNPEEIKHLMLFLKDEQENNKWLRGRMPLPTNHVKTKKDVINYCITLVETKIARREVGRAWATWVLEGLQRTLEKMS